MRINIIKTGIIFIIIFALFLGLQLSFSTVPDADPFYHYGFSKLLASTRISTSFPWAHFTSLNQNFSDQGFLFHYLMMPFTLIKFPWGLKIFTALFSSLMLMVFYQLLKKLQIKLPLVWLIILLVSSSSFLFRLQLGRPLLVTITLSLLGSYWLIKEKSVLLFFWSLIFVLVSDVSLFIIAVLLASFLLVSIINKSHTKPLASGLVWDGERLKIIPLLSSGLGTIGGILAHPQPLNYLNILWQNYLVCPLITLGVDLNSAIELQSLGLNDFLSNSTILFLCLLFTFILLFLLKINRNNLLTKKQQNTKNYLLILTMVFLILTFLYNRFIEYLAPLAVLLTGYCFTIFYNSPKSPELQILISNLKKYLNKVPVKILLVLTAVSLLFLPVKKFYTDIKDNDPVDRYQTTDEWLKNNTPKRSIIFHASWDSFHRLFFYNQHNYYIVGFNPSFLYLYDQNLYWLWRNITEKSIACAAPTDSIDLKDLTSLNGCTAEQQTPGIIAQTIKTRFQSEYIWINDYEIYRDFKKFLENNPEFFEKKIETSDSAVFKIN